MTEPIRHLVPLGAENRWSNLIAMLIELDPNPVADLLGLGDSPTGVTVEREAPAGRGGRVDLIVSVNGEKRCVAEAKVLSGLRHGQLRRYREHHSEVPHHVLITLRHFPIDAPPPSGWRSVRWEDLLRALSGSEVPVVAETAAAWLSYVDSRMPRLTAETRWNDLEQGEDFVLALRARMAWVHRRLESPDGVEHDLVPSTAGQSWVVRMYRETPRQGYWIYVEAEERLSVRAYPKYAGASGWGTVQGPSVKVCLMQTGVRTSKGFDWTYLRSLWPTMEAARTDWVTTSAKPRAGHDREAWVRMVAAGGPRHLGIGFGEMQARQRGECMFGARFQLPADAALGTVAAELDATSKLLLDLAALPG